jgi:hypothetical protein
MSRTERALVRDFEEWRDTRRELADRLHEGLVSGDFSDLIPEPNEPELDELEDALTTAMEDPMGTAATLGFFIGHHHQRGVLGAWNRTTAVRRISRRDALALVRRELEDGRRRDDQLETLIMVDDAPEGVQ